MSLTITALFVGGLAVAQKEPIQSITYAQTKDLAYCSKIPHNTTVLEYISQDGTVLRKGAALKIGRPSTPTGFTWLFVGGRTSAMIGSATPMAASYQGEEIEIDQIIVSHLRATKNSLVRVYVFAINPNLGSGASARTIADYEQALMLGEVINPNGAMTRDQAIAKLKEFKDLLELGVITQSKYDSLKAILTPIITKQE